ncbi:MAG: hypothetical protein ACXVJN_15175 [Mucilaginibacter sp.]
MEKLPFDTANIDADDVQALEDTYKALKSKFKVALTEDQTFDIKKFDVFSNYQDISVGGSLLINHPEKGCYLTFLKVRTHVPNGRGPAIDYFKYQVWASATLRSDFGRMVIRRETFADKILNLVHPTEMRFKGHRAFGQKFNVVADNEQKAVPAMTRAFRNELMEISADDFIIEIVNSTLVIGNVQPVDPKQIVYFAEIASKLSTIK